MVKIYCEFIGVLMGKTGRWKSKIMIDEPVTVWTLIQRLLTDFKLEDNILMDRQSGSIGQNALVLVNGKEISVLEGLETRLKDDDLVTIIPVSHGG